MAQIDDLNGDTMELDREDSPATIRNSSPPYHDASHTESQHEIIDLDPMEESSGPCFKQDDFMTDEDFEEIYGQPQQPDSYSNATLAYESQTPYRKVIGSFSCHGRTYQKGTTIQLEDGDFVRISEILQDTRSKEHSFCGQRFRRTSSFKGLFDQHLNEVVMFSERVEQIEKKAVQAREPELDTFLVSHAVKSRDLILTNEAYPAYSFREDSRSLELPRATARESCRLVCRWKVALKFRVKTTRKACVEMSITRLQTKESDHGYRARDVALRQEWRGVTVKGGSCQSWLPGEEQFDIVERKRNQGINILGFHQHALAVRHQDTIDLTCDTTPQPSKRRYTFGDAFCGAGGASRAAKSVGYRVDWACDFDPAPIESYKQNFFEARCEATPVHLFVTCIDESYVVDVLHLSPPCKTFSPIHTRVGKDDEANSATFFAVEELLKKAKPRIVTMENTFGLVERWREWLNSMVRFFTSLGFSVRWKVFNLAEYGLPQARRRLIVFASCPGERLPEFPEATHGPGRISFATINDAIGRIPSDAPDHDVAGAAKRNAPRYNGDLPLRNCITTGGSLDYHPDGKRTFTDRELACLQGFPLEHVFGSNKKKMQIGNSFPPLAAKVFFACILRHLEESDRQGMMNPERSFKEIKDEVSAALIGTTRTIGQVSNEDVAFQRSVDPKVDRLIEEQSRRLLSLVNHLNKTATAGTETVAPPLTNVDSVEDGWRGIVDVLDNLLEKADACLDEFTGVVKKLIPNHQNGGAAADAKRPLAKHEYRFQNLPKPQRLFRKLPKNDETTPFKPLLQSKPNAVVPLDDSLELAPAPDGSIQYGSSFSHPAYVQRIDIQTRYKHPYETEIKQSTYPPRVYVQSDPLPFPPFESTDAVWVDTPEAVQEMVHELKQATEIAVDLEHHETHSYVGLVSLMQISTREKDWIVDTLVPWREDLQVLNEVFTDSRIVKARRSVLHGSTSDMVWLQRDLGLYVVGLFDTYHASNVLEYPRHGLAYLLQRFVAFDTDKRYQMADWRMRPLPKQMYDYARSDTHFLLYIFDCIRNELLSKSNPADPHRNLIDQVCDLSKDEALQRYERYVYDAKNGSGVWGWHGVLSWSPGRWNRQQIAVFRAVHEWRDRTARQLDEGIQQILTNKAILVVAREMPMDMPSLLSHCQPLHKETRESAPELLQVIRKAKAEGSGGPEFDDLITPRAYATTSHVNPPLHTSSMNINVPFKTFSNTMPATLVVSQFWGRLIDKDTGEVRSLNPRRIENPHLALPLPPLTAEMFETKASGEFSTPLTSRSDPGARAEHQYTKKRKAQEEDVFVLKQKWGLKKRKAAETLDGLEPGRMAGENGVKAGIDTNMEDLSVGIKDAQEADDKARRNQERKIRKRIEKEQKKQEELNRINGQGEGEAKEGGQEAFDYDRAPSVLHAQRKHDGAAGTRKGIDPYSKSLDAAKGIRKVHREGPGRSMIYKS
ncbi:MAG: hypothetical protein Q9216_000220 [Gyalolechia sp. 2 TL-2023]